MASTLAARTPPQQGVEAAIYAEQVAAIFRQMPIALGVNAVNVALTALVLAPLATPALVLLFFVAVMAATVARLALWQRYRRASDAADPRYWSRLATAGSLVTGLCWGIGGAVLFPVIPTVGKIFLAIVIGGMCAGAAVVNASHLPTLLAFVTAASLPMAARFLADGSPAGAALGAMTIVFAAALSLAASHLNHILAAAMRLRFELNEANLSLQAEIAEHRATEAVLRQAQKLEAIGQLTGGIAHDFNNLLTVVIGNLQLARGRTRDGSPITRPLDAALRAAEQGSAVIQRLLTFARRQHLDPRSLDLAVLVAGIDDLLRRTLGPEIHLVTRAAADLAPAQVDANQLELAILNLTLNARDAMPDGGTVHLSLDNRSAGDAAPAELVPGHYVVVSISDDGGGMDEATLARAFEPFFTTKQLGSGTGLGLPMVQGFAAQSGGAVRIASAPGQGTTVELWLPRAEEPPAAAPVEPAPAASAGRGAASILLCEDDDHVRRLLGEFLASLGYTVHEAGGGEAAIRLLDSGAAADVLIVDFAMPGIDGVETIRRAKERRPELRSLLITGQAGGLSSSHAAGIPVLRKPFAPADLARRVGEILAA